MSNRRLEYLLVIATLCLGLLHTWTGRYSMNPDGMSYLDVGESFFRHDWANAVNAWWSPLYPWTIGIVLGVFRPSPRLEFPLVHAVNFGIFVLALAAFRFFLHGLIALRHERREQASPEESNYTPDWALIIIGYAIFWWIALEIETLYDISPDLAVAACCFAIAGILIRLWPTGSSWSFVIFGLMLGIGYWTKAVLFPLGFVTLAAAYWWKRGEPKWRKGILIATVIFLCASVPLIFLLSKQKGRFTFGDSGRVNYAWAVSPRSPLRNWQGREPDSGTPLHPTRQLLQHPPLFEFDGPVIGTYPPWTDPSYWNEGVKPHVRLKPQIEVLLTTVPSELRLLTRAQPALVVGVIAVALLAGSTWLTNLLSIWPLIAISLTGMAMYVPLVENDRYVGGFLLVIFLCLIWAASTAGQQARAITYVSLAVFIAMALGTADYTVRVLTRHYAIPGVGPNSALEDVAAAEQLRKLGLQPGDKVGIITNGTGAYWATLAHLRIVAEIMDTGHGSQEFWNSLPEVKANVFRAFAQAHASNVVGVCPVCPPGVPDGWRKLAGTPYCIHPVP